jgi:cysteine sulfinate desulfinase/cysteine desulfurase-like protein
MKGIRLRGAPMYLDMQATTPLDPRVLDAMLPYMVDQVGGRDGVSRHLAAMPLEHRAEGAATRGSPRQQKAAAASRSTSTHHSPPTFPLPPPPSPHRRPAAQYGNPHSRTHMYGWESEDAVEKARGEVASLVGADPKEIVFTSGATESNNMAIKGIAGFYKEKKKHVITTQTEHKCVLDSCRWVCAGSGAGGRR